MATQIAKQQKVIKDCYEDLFRVWKRDIKDKSERETVIKEHMDRIKSFAPKMEPAQINEFHAFVVKFNIQFQENNDYDPLMLKFVQSAELEALSKEINIQIEKKFEQE